MHVAPSMHGAPSSARTSLSQVGNMRGTISADRRSLVVQASRQLRMHSNTDSVTAW